MPLLKMVSTKRFAVCLGMVAVAAMVMVFRHVLADSGPVLSNVNPQGTVTSSSVKITLDTEDLARCRYSANDTGYDSMANELETPDGLYHSATVGALAKGSYTYYVRCKDFEGNANGLSALVKFTVGEINCVGENCPTINPVATPSGDTTPPSLSGFLPTGTVYSGYAVLSVTTNEAAACRYSWYDKAYDAMTLPFSTSNKLYHTASATLSQGGSYNYYVRCKDTTGNINPAAGMITFRYSAPYVAPVVKTPVVVVPVVKTPADTTPPTISVLEPSGDIATPTVKISCVTDETASCKYGKTDTDYDSLTDAMDDNATNHSKQITLDAPGEYVYYVRCKDAKDNKDTASGKISFNYVSPEGPVISDLQPTGAIFQSNVALIVTTDKPADCRYADSDIDFDQMSDSFDTNDGSLHQATVNLPDYGSFAYYVRCRDKNGTKDDKSEVINFEYKNPNPPDVSLATSTPLFATSTPPISCSEIKAGDKDGVCDKTADCVCDPDCSGQDADPDCPVTGGGGGGWIAIALIGLILLVVAGVIIVIIKRRGSEENDVELP